MNIRSALIAATKKLQQKNIPSARLDAEVLLSFILKKPREWLLSHDDTALRPRAYQQFQSLAARRAKYEPIAYIIGHKDFFGQTFKVSPAVLIPRPETELLVEEVLSRAGRSDKKSPKIVDIGTGSGVIALSLAKNLPKARILALEAYADALNLAKFNARQLKLPKAAIMFKKADLLAGVSAKQIDGAILVANLPYLDRDTAKNYPPVIRRELSYEPASALYAKKHGTALYEKLFQQIVKLPIRPQALIIEIDSHHWREFLKLAKEYFPSCKIAVSKDYAGKHRLISIDWE